MQVHVTHVRFPGNWEVLYVQGEKVASGHTIEVSDVLREVEGHTITGWDSHYADVNLTEEFRGEAPDEYSALPPK